MGARWWQWALSIPVADNPLFDPTGANTYSSQSGNVFFLAGQMWLTLPEENLAKAERTIVIPSDTWFFFPILNTEADQIGFPEPLPTVPDLYDMAANGLSGITEMWATIDGRPIQNITAYRAKSPGPFSFVLPETDNVYQFWGVDVTGVISPAVSDGYWLMIAPLAVGQHEITFGGSFGDAFTLDIKYNITVKPGKK